MCLAQCFTKTFSFEFLDSPMESELLSLLYKYGTETQRGKRLAQCYTAHQKEEPGFKPMSF